MLLNNVFTHGQTLPPDDKVIYNYPEFQTLADITTSFNGWTYCVVAYKNNNVNGGYHLVMSKDNGVHWNTIENMDYNFGYTPALDIVVTGSDTNNLALYLAGTYRSFDNQSNTLFIKSYDGRTGTFITQNYSKDYADRAIYDVAIASDYLMPANGVTGYSVGVAYTCFSQFVDSANFVLSTNAGLTFSSPVNIANTPLYMRNISLAYGKSASATEGRYFVALDGFTSTDASNGQIFTCRNTGGITSAFTPLQGLDFLDNSTMELCNNPVIAVSHGVDNDSLSCTAIVVANRNTGGNCDIVSFYNKRAYSNNFWQYQGVATNTNTYDTNPDLFFESTLNTFLLTYADSTNSQLKQGAVSYNYPTNYIIEPTYYNDFALGWTSAKTVPKVSKSPAKNYPEFAWITTSGVFGGSSGVGFYDAGQIALNITATENTQTFVASFPVTFTFSETVTNFDLSDIVTSNCTLTNFTGSGTTYTAIINLSNAGIASIEVLNDVALPNNSHDIFEILYEPLSVNEVNANNLFSAFPNPANNIVRIVVANNALTVKAIQVYNMSGQVVNQYSAAMLSNNSIDISNLPSGIYILDVVLSNKQRGKTRVVKM